VRHARGVVALFGAASFVGAALLFLVEPLLAKLVLPYFGGSPMVWNTCTLFFQALLLASYLYVHVSTRRLGARRQPWAHLALLLLPLLVLPVALPADPGPPAGSDPALWLLRVLLVAVGLPFALLAATGPLLQRWFSWTGHARAHDPYFLYAASNAGSVLGLLGYPFLVEPLMGLSAQARWWSGAYVVFAALVASCGVLALRASRRLPRAAAVPVGGVRTGSGDGSPTGRRRLSWVVLAFLPSSLMLGVTTHASTDIAPIPLFWTVPLAIYLATFVLAFGRSSRRPPRGAAVVASLLAIVALLDAGSSWAPPVWFSLLLGVATLAATGLAAHGRLAADRPAPERLTGFYLLVALGGALGGLLNGLLAPVLLDRLLEYPLVLCFVPLLLIGVVQVGSPRSLALRPVVWVSGLLLVGTVVQGVLQPAVLLRERTFYGSYRVSGSDQVLRLSHGTTLHGWELRRGPHRGEPTAYYARSGPVGDVIAAYPASASSGRVAVVGLGVGTLAAYGESGQRMDFYEIDPAVVRIARDSGLFSFLRRSKADVRIVVGDGRLSLQRVPDATYGLVVLDAFSSDAIPSHLLTTQALADYRRTLAPGGLLAVHITNRHLRLAPVLAAQARQLGMAGVVRTDPVVSEVQANSDWVVLARDEQDLQPLRDKGDWLSLAGPPVRAWTDDYASLVRVVDLGWP
jgi:SAM-dependent methyltransferase